MGVEGGYNFSQVGVGSGVGGREVMGGLRAWVQYAVVVRAYNSHGAGPLSQPIVVRTLEDGKHFHFLRSFSILFFSGIFCLTSYGKQCTSFFTSIVSVQKALVLDDYVVSFSFLFSLVIHEEPASSCATELFFFLHFPRVQLLLVSISVCHPQHRQTLPNSFSASLIWHSIRHNGPK